MAQRRAPAFGISDGQTTGAQPTVPTPYSGTGTDTNTELLTPDMQPPGMETAGQLRRRTMPVAGPIGGEPDLLTLVQQMVAQRGGG